MSNNAWRESPVAGPCPGLRRPLAELSARLPGRFSLWLAWRGARGVRSGPLRLQAAEEGNFVAVRPSGTEPKIKFYMFTFVSAEQLADLETTKEETAQRLDQLETDLQAFAETD